MSDSWITVPNWERFQHYGLARRPLWIKNYTTLLQKDEYLDLPLAARGLLHGIWLAYADRDGRLRTSDVPAVCLGRARGAHLAALNHAGLISFCASKPLLLSLSQEQGQPAAEKPATNLHVVAASKSDRLHDQFTAEAAQLAKGWNGGGSDLFDEQLTRLETEYHRPLRSLEREELWDLAFQRRPVPDDDEDELF